MRTGLDASRNAVSLPDKSPSLHDFIIDDDLAMYGAQSDAKPTIERTAASHGSGATLQLPSGPLALPPASPFPESTRTSPRPDLTLSAVPTPLADLLPLAHVSVRCAFSTTTALHAHLDAIDLVNPDRLRPQWDTCVTLTLRSDELSYFMLLAELASLRSNCMKRRVGAVLVSERRVVSTGYNGTPRGLRNCADGGCARCNGRTSCGVALDECLCLHAEENALLEAGRDRAASSPLGGVLYCNTSVARACAR